MPELPPPEVDEFLAEPGHPARIGTTEKRYTPANRADGDVDTTADQPRVLCGIRHSWCHQ